MSIHPSAIVDPRAEIAGDVEIGPFAVIEAGVQIGARCLIHGNAQLIGSVQLGEGCEIGHGSVVGGLPQDLGFDRRTPSGVVIGPGNVIREHNTIHRSTREGENTTMGRDNYLMVGCHLAHDVVMGDSNIFANNCLIAGHAILGSGIFLGGGVGVHQFVRIGDRCMAQGHAGISQDLPPYALVADINIVRGLNIVGMRRAGLSSESRLSVKEAYRLMYQAGLNLADALSAADARDDWSPEARTFIDFFRVPTKRGVCHP